MLIWIFGQSGAGKSTLAKRLIDVLHTQRVIHIDGDNIRSIFDNKDYSKAGRLKNGDFAIQLAKYLNNQGLDVIVSLITPYIETRRKVKQEFPKAIMVELEYAQDRTPEERLVNDYEKGEHDLLIDTTKFNSEEAFNLLFDFICKKI